MSDHNVEDDEPLSDHDSEDDGSQYDGSEDEDFVPPGTIKKNRLALLEGLSNDEINSINLIMKSLDPNKKVDPNELQKAKDKMQANMTDTKDEGMFEYLKRSLDIMPNNLFERIVKDHPLYQQLQDRIIELELNNNILQLQLKTN